MREDGESEVEFNNPKWRLAGGAWGGDAESLLSWHHHYYITLDRYMEKQRFAGNDQAIMATTCMGSIRKECMAKGLTSRAALQLLQGLDKLWVLQFEPFEGAVLVDLVGAVLHVDLEVLFGVRADDVRDPRQPDRLLPTGFQIGEESFRAGSNQNHLRCET